MKSIVIILAIFLITLTAKADWVKSGELEFLQISDSNFDFAKVNDEGTKIVALSKKEKILKLWDLTTGKLIRELAMPYKFDRIEYDFKEEILYFNLFSSGDVNLPKVNSDVTWYLDSFGKINYVYYTHNLFLFSNSRAGYPSLNLIDNKIYSNILYHSFNGGDVNRYNALQVIDNRNSGSYTNSKAYGGNLSEETFKGGTYFTGGVWFSGRYNQKIETNTHSIISKWGISSFDINDKSAGVTFNFSNFTKLDIDYGYLVCSDDNYNIKYLSLTNNKVISFTGKYPKVDFRQYKLIKGIKNAVYLKGKDTLAVYDNETGIEFAQYQFYEGQLAFNDEKQIVYSYSGNKICKLDISNINLEQVLISSDKQYYFIGDTVSINTTLPKLITDVIIEVNGVKSYGRTSKVVMDKVGTFDIKITYTQNGEKKEILMSKFIKVVERFKPKLLVTHPNTNMYSLPFSFSCTSNYNSSQITYTFRTQEIIALRADNPYEIKSQRTDNISITGSSITYSFKSVNNYNYTLVCSNGYESITLQGQLRIRPYCEFYLDKYSGNAPLTLNWNSIVKGPSLDAPAFVDQWDATLVVGNNRITSKIFTIKNPGVYPISVELFQGYLNRKEIFTTNKVLKVLDTTMIQAFPSKFKYVFANKYAMTQDAEGYYLDFANGEADIQLFDSMGHLIKSYHIKAEEYIRKEDLERGVYFLQINVNGEVYHEKVLVE